MSIAIAALDSRALDLYIYSYSYTSLAIITYVIMKTIAS